MQKGVDMRLGIDVASLAYKGSVEQIVLIIGDSDFVPAAKLARREGIDVVIDPLGHDLHDHLYEHTDGVRNLLPKGGVNKGSEESTVRKPMSERSARPANARGAISV